MRLGYYIGAVQEPTKCNRAECPEAAQVACAFVDRRGRPCTTAWCRNHATALWGRPYCARHASTLVAVGQEGIQKGHLPELENRVPSLVYCVGRDLDADMMNLLGQLADRHSGESVASEPVSLVTGGGRTQERRWERNWKIFSHTGISRRVTVQVLESDPTSVMVRVDRELVDTGIPPWISLRGSASTEKEERDQFYGRIRERVAYAASQRPQGYRPY